jgi:hypothetical protein
MTRAFRWREVRWFARGGGTGTGLGGLERLGVDGGEACAADFVGRVV